MLRSSEHVIPIRLGSTEEFARVAGSLRQAHYDEKSICGSLGIQKMSEIGPVNSDQVDFGGLPDQFPCLVRLFLFQMQLPQTDVEAVLGREALSAFYSLGLLGKDEFGGGLVYAKVLLYPVAGFLIASDRHSNPDGSEFHPPPDIVFPAIFGGTLRFLRLITGGSGGEALDLCAGSGIGSFVLSRRYGRSVSSDVTERASHFARFNKALNALENVEVVRGDLYSAVEGREFDCIVAHPPYVPSLGTVAIWRDGGVTGEMLSRRIIEGLPQHLRAGGHSCIVTLGLDTRDGAFEERVRGWLGRAGDRFDIIFAAADERTPGEILGNLAEKGSEFGTEALRQMRQAFAKAGVLRMPYGALVLRRHARSDAHPAWTLRTKLGDPTTGEDFVRAFVLHRRITSPGFLDDLAAGFPRLAPRLKVQVTHLVKEGTLVPGEYLFETDKPFTTVGRVDPWLVPMFTRLDGSVSPARVYEEARAKSEIPDGFQLRDFAVLVARLLERGYLVLPDPGEDGPDLEEE